MERKTVSHPSTFPAIPRHRISINTVSHNTLTVIRCSLKPTDRELIETHCLDHFQPGLVTKAVLAPILLAPCDAGMSTALVLSVFCLLQNNSTFHNGNPPHQVRSRMRWKGDRVGGMGHEEGIGKWTATWNPLLLVQVWVVQPGQQGQASGTEIPPKNAVGTVLMLPHFHTGSYSG